MYTEDDEKVKVKGKNSNNDYNDFYTAFSGPEKKEEKEVKKEAKKKSKKEEKKIEKTEEDYSDFYGLDDEVDEPTPITTNKNRGNNKNNNNNLTKIGLILLLLIVFVVVLILILGNRVRGDIEITNNDISLKSGESEYISYKVVGTDKEVKSTFTSSNPDVATVSENGEIKAVAGGEATISINYTIEGKTRKKDIIVKVIGPEVKHEITLNLSASETKWTNKDVTISVDAKTDSEISSLKYAINCTGNCDYKDVSGNKIVISNNGITKIKVVAKDKNNQEATKEIEVKIDKQAPTVEYSGSNNIVSNNDVEVCVTCNDDISGCKQNKVCKKFTSSKTNQVIAVSDNAGNTVNSPSFNITINRSKLSCSLKVSSDGTVSATLGGTASYYGFSSNYSGNNELSKKIDINVSKDGERGAKVIQYYIKDKNGNVANCHITVIKTCKCTNSTGENCPATCTFTSS